jgi:hypothetical protein
MNGGGGGGGCERIKQLMAIGRPLINKARTIRFP